MSLPDHSRTTLPLDWRGHLDQEQHLPTPTPAVDVLLSSELDTEREWLFLDPDGGEESFIRVEDERDLQKVKR